MTELIDTYASDRTPLGTAPRHEAHATGLWHFVCHYWLVTRSGGRLWLLFQQRSPQHPSFGGLFDVTAAGHLQAGERTGDGIRELEEELGIVPEPGRLTQLGTIKDSPGQTTDNEFVHLFVYNAPVNADFRIQESEVAGLWRAPLEQAAAFFAGRSARLMLVGVGRQSQESRRVTLADFTPHDPGYYEKTTAQILAMAAKGRI